MSNLSLPLPSTLSSTGFKRKRHSSQSPKPLEGDTHTPRKRHNLGLAITIPSLGDFTTNHDSEDDATSHISGLSDPDSLFDEKSPWLSSDTLDTSLYPSRSPAFLSAPPIPGLYFDPTLRLPVTLAESVKQYCLEKYFHHEGVNQVMLFGRFISPCSPSSGKVNSDGLPSILLQLLSELETMLVPILPSKTYDLLFPRVPTQARQAILNLYQPGEGITPHVDLLRRFGDGIIGVSFGSGCVMQFAKANESAKGLDKSSEKIDGKCERSNWDVYLPERSVIVLSEDARFKWTHGIGKHTKDFVAPSDAADNTAGQWIERGVRLSITFRWLLPGADVVGEESISS